MLPQILVTAMPSGKELRDCPNARNKFEHAAMLVLAKPLSKGAIDAGIHEATLITDKAAFALIMALGVLPKEEYISFSELKSRFKNEVFDKLNTDKKFPYWAVESAREFCKATLATAGLLKFAQ